MAYIAPGPTAANITLDAGPYIAPGPTAANFDLATYGDDVAPIIYSIVPGVIASFGLPWRPKPSAREITVSAPHQNAERHDIARSLNAAGASARPEPRIRSPFQSAEIRNREAGLRWLSAIARDLQLEAPHGDAPAKDHSRGVRWETAGKLLDVDLESSFLVLTPWKDLTRVSRFFSSAIYSAPYPLAPQWSEPLALVRYGLADLALVNRRNARDPGRIDFGGRIPQRAIQPRDPQWFARFGTANTADRQNVIPWGSGNPVDVKIAVVAPAYSGPIGETDSNTGDGETFVVPTLRFYIVANSAQIVRVSDGRDIPAESVQLSINADSFAWSMSARVAGRDAFALLEGTDAEPVDVDVIINGESWRLMVDGWNDSQSFGSSSVTIRGRSRAAYLAAPYSNPRDYAETSEKLAQQLAAQELPAGWLLDWGLDDWIVPAGAWKYQGLTPVAAVSRIAAAAGGYLQADRSLDKLHVRSLYPAAPWNWSAEAPDFSIPRDLILQRSSSKFPGQGVNGVYVHGGEPGGILAKVVRTGTTGNILAPTIVDPLITAPVAARWRGVAALAATARQSREVHELPLSADLGGLIEPGALVLTTEVFDGDNVPLWRGMVRGVTVSAGARRGNNGGVVLSVRQQLDIERHFEG